MAKQENPKKQHETEFHEALGGAQTLPTADVSAASSAALWTIMAIIALALIAAIVATVLNNRTTFTPSGVAAGSIIPLNSTIDTARVTQARALAQPQDENPNAGTGEVSPMANGYGDTYAIQGSVGTAGARHPEPSSDLTK